MDRKEFLSALGLGSTALIAIACLQACSKTDAASGPALDFTLDLTNGAYSALSNPGGYVTVQGVVVARTTNNSYLAVSAACPHEGINVEYQGNQNQFFCPAHSSYFSSSGSRTAGPAQRGLTQYQTALTGNSLRVYA